MNIKVRKDRYLINDSSNWGTQYDNLATTLFFEFPEFIDKDGLYIPTKLLNKYIVFDIESEENQDLIINNKYSIPYDIAKLNEITFLVKMTEASDDEDVSDKLIWNSRKLKISLNTGLEGKTNITSEKIDAFNTAVTTLNQKTAEVDTTIKTVETKVETGEFNGENGLTPYILNGYWYIGEENTGVRAEGKDGQDYIITNSDKQEIANDIKIDIQPTLNEIEDIAKTAESIAKGRATGYVFDTVENLELWLENADNRTKLVLGDNLYVRAIGVPDYWWDGNEKQVLETQKVDLTEYVTQDEFNEKIGDISSLLDSINGEVI